MTMVMGAESQPHQACGLEQISLAELFRRSYVWWRQTPRANEAEDALNTYVETRAFPRPVLDYASRILRKHKR